MRTIFLALTALFVISCNTENKKASIKESNLDSIAPISNEVLENAVIYEANIRQYSPEGTFNKFTEDIPKLKELGVKILWVMPIYPISTTNSKGSLGSYYAISNYTEVNPEFGNLEDVKKLVKTAHENGIYVILDWVANHTGWDHNWLKEHPEYYSKDEKGEITHTLGTDWTDVADLNYENENMRTEMLNDMKYWVNEVNIDGFRCDVAGMVPVDFWENATVELNKIKPVFMLAEAWEPELMKNAFDMEYSWDRHHIMNNIAQRKENVSSWDKKMKEIDTVYQNDDILMNFITNHDENSWSGTVSERLGNATETMLALTYCTPGMPLIYSGQEYDMNKRLRFFEKDTIVKTNGKMWPLMEKLGVLKNNNKALNGGKNPASYQRIKSSNDKDILVFSREKEGNEIIYLANLTDKETNFTVDIDGEFTDYFSGEKVLFSKTNPLSFKAWQYKILIK